MKKFKFKRAEELKINMNQNGHKILEVLTITVQQIISITEKLLHTLLLEKMFNSILNMSLSGLTTAATPIQMAQLTISTMVRPVLTVS
jgi:hypothetical protein